jgi:hypothetical protein
VFSLGLLVMISDPDDGPHPRYLSPALLPLVLLVAAGFGPASAAIAARFGRHVRTVFVTCALVFAFAHVGSYLQGHLPKVWLRDGLYRAIDREYIYDAVVIVRAQYPSRYARNVGAPVPGQFLHEGGPLVDAPFAGVLYLSVPPSVTKAEVAAAYPDRKIIEAFEGETWTLR